MRFLPSAARAALAFGLFICAASADARAPDSDIPGKFTKPLSQNDYEKRVEMIPMRDGVKLYTVIVIPKGAKGAPMILTRTPYNAKKRAEREDSPYMLSMLPLADEDFVSAGYIRVYQDIRGKYGSEGAYEMTRFPRGPFNSTKTDDTTDAWDTIDWLVKHVPQSNGRVGMIGSSYEGWTVVMALLDPHPALKAAVPESPMVDGWMGDDWFHYGAFREPNMDYTASQTEQRGEGHGVPRAAYDDYETFLQAGSPAGYAKQNGFEQLGWWRKMSEHPAYDAFWQDQALDKFVAAHPSNVPTLWEQGLWDQEDMWGANHSWLALKAAGHEANNWLVMGPWFHSQVNREGFALGPYKWDGDTAHQFRRDMVLPFFNQYLKDGPPANLARAMIYNPAENHWQRFDDWPGACETGCAHPMMPLYLHAGFGLSFDKPTAADDGDSYVSDPAKPVPYLPRPIRFSDTDQWRTWLVRDQRFVDGRPDILTYETAPLTSAVKIEGAPVADIVASTTGTDGDFVVKLIDVYPPEVPSDPELGGAELPIGTDIFRGRYRKSFEHPSAIPANTPEHYRFALPNQNYVFRPGHRIMVQIQSTLFPLYDRNPQTYVENPLLAKPSDYKKATVTVLHAGENASAIWLPVVR
ncbi:MAG TPA: CocE/NonD family hydrolase [Rhizomicrobium sp.]|nr:CocE/NonD family hydrolase [Rhizomicrobium sp.]